MASMERGVSSPSTARPLTSSVSSWKCSSSRRSSSARSGSRSERLAVTGGGVDGARGQFAQHGKAFDEFGELLEMLVEQAIKLGAVGQGNYQARLAGVKVAQVVDLADVFFARAVNCRRSDSQQLVGGLTHGRNDDDRPAAGAGFDDRRYALDGGRRFHRRAAEFHDDHQSSIPSECISSALSTAAPAAPRTVLWASATNL